MKPVRGQLELDLGDAASVRRRLGRTGSHVLDWAPLWVPVLVFAQLAWGGLRPALAESRRLDEAERAVHARVQALSRERRQLDEDGARLTDPIYRERVRKSLLVPGGEPLTLERARAQAGRAAELEAAARARGGAVDGP